MAGASAFPEAGRGLTGIWLENALPKCRQTLRTKVGQSYSEVTLVTGGPRISRTWGPWADSVCTLWYRHGETVVARGRGAVARRTAARRCGAPEQVHQFAHVGAHSDERDRSSSSAALTDRQDVDRRPPQPIARRCCRIVHTTNEAICSVFFRL